MEEMRDALPHDHLFPLSDGEYLLRSDGNDSDVGPIDFCRDFHRGTLDDINIAGLGRNRDALIRIDYVKDEVVLLMSDAGKGSGQIRTSSTGEANFIDYTRDAALKALWTDLQASMPLVTDDPI